MSPLRFIRQVVAPTGRHRAATASKPAREPLGTWPKSLPERAHGAAVAQAWDDCAPCGKPTAGLLHKNGWTCGECFTTTTATGD
ncbi:hypothetical protein [Streptomyces spiralis]|uniref:hypothetical protein n=1 Tax=Streptomyces spiralis TaxID=66376 RepID=UPI0036962861